MSHDDQLLWAATPAREWLEAVPLGNGRLGGVVHGGPGRGAAAERRLRAVQGGWSQAYLPFADLHLTVAGAGVEAYTRQLDLETATHRVSYRLGGVGFEWVCFVSQADGVLVLTVDAD